MELFEGMSVFVCVADHGSFAAAAKVRSLSTTMVANHVRHLEARLGVRLIERTTRRHALTTVGRAYLDRCREVLAMVESADGIPDAIQVVAQGRLRVTAPVSYGTHRLMPVVAAFLQAYPQVQVDLTLDDRIVDLVGEGFDVGVRSGPVADTGVIARPLLRSRMHAVASPRYLAMHGAPAHPRDLDGHNLILFAAWGPDARWRFTRGSDTVIVPVRGRLATNNGQALLVAALAGVGIVVQADVLLSPQIRAGELVEVLPGWALPTREIHVVYRPEGRASAKVRHFVDFVAAGLGGSGDG